MEPLISVIVPVYNIEKYIGRCIDSIINQTYRNLEIILVDDGSTDASGRICDEYARHDARIRVIHKENEGQSKARNHGIKIANGSMIFFVDGDDYIAKRTLYNLYNVKKDTGAKISCCLFQMTRDFCLPDVDDNSNTFQTQLLSCVEALEKLLRQSDIPCSPWAKLYDRDLFQDITYPVGEIMEDFGTTYKLFAKSDLIALLMFNGYYYYVRSGSTMKSPFTKAKMSELKFAKEQKAFLDRAFPELEMATTDRLVSSCFHILFSIMGKKEFRAEQSEVKAIIIANRKRLLRSNNTSKKTRYGCLLSYLGFHTAYLIYCLSGVREKMIS